MMSDEDYQQVGNDAADMNVGATVEGGHRKRGRPLGSKNKPKPPAVATHESESAMRMHVLEVPAGHDIAASVSNYAQTIGMSVCVLTGTGVVSDVTLHEPGTGSLRTFPGHFHILSMWATFLPQDGNPVSINSNFAVTLSASPGHKVIGGLVAGRLMAALHPTVVLATVFTSPTYQQLPLYSAAGTHGDAGADGDGDH